MGCPCTVSYTHLNFITIEKGIFSLTEFLIRGFPKRGNIVAGQICRDFSFYMKKFNVSDLLVSSLVSCYMNTKSGYVLSLIHIQMCIRDRYYTFFKMKLLLRSIICGSTTCCECLFMQSGLTIRTRAVSYGTTSQFVYTTCIYIIFVVFLCYIGIIYVLSLIHIQMCIRDSCWCHSNLPFRRLSRNTKLILGNMIIGCAEDDISVSCKLTVDVHIKQRCCLTRSLSKITLSQGTY